MIFLNNKPTSGLMARNGSFHLNRFTPVPNTLNEGRRNRDLSESLNSDSQYVLDGKSYSKGKDCKKSND